MNNSKLVLMLAATAAAAVSGCNKMGTGATNQSTAEMKTQSASTNAPASNDPVASAESAAPASIAHDASVVTVGADGKMTTVRQGKNGWTCVPDAPDTPGPDPMCFDANAAKWVDAWVHHQTPPGDATGLMYMLAGGTDASNSDPYAKKPTADNDWIKTGPHIMIVGSKDILNGQPSGAKPNTSAPYVMWAGT